jgi:predicted lipoprotein with Yx(FWY)xxD motif
MELIKQASVDQITVTELGFVLVREVTRVMEGETVLSETYHRTSFTPGQDVSSQSANVQSICAAAWTPEVVAAYEAVALLR